MKKLTLDQTWKLCLSMWRWIAKQIRQGSFLSVRLLKRIWLENHGYYDKEISENCFFCEYSERHKFKDCDGCPGIKVDIEFGCGKSEYDWFSNPIAFYNKLRALNRRRMAKKNK